MNAPTIHTERLTLRAFTPDDAEAYHRAVSGDIQVMRTLATGITYTLEHTRERLIARREYWERHGFGPWAVTLRADGTLMGHVGLARMAESDEVELFYALGAAYWGQGYATEAARPVLEYGFKTVGLARIIGIAMVDNLASQRVMQKLGMVYLGVTNRYYGMHAALYERTTPP